MKANELRIGNWIARGGNGEYFQATPETISDLSGGRIAPTGIPLTEEWLLRMGFEYRNEYRKDGAILDKKLTVSSREINVSLAFCDIYTGKGYYYLSAPQSIPLIYVHQLQNLIHALTGEGLEIKL